MTVCNTSGHISTVIDYLNRSAQYAVLRNYENLPDSNRSRDIDIIISEQSFKTIRQELVRLIDRSGWKIITYLYSDRLTTFVCGVQQGNNTEVVQWDFFMHTSVFGIMLMDADEFLTRRKFNGFLYHVDDEGEFLDKYLYNRAVGSRYPAKYKSLRQQVTDSDAVRSKLSQIYGVSSLAECDKMPGKWLLLRALWYNITKHPFGTAGRIIFFLYTFIRNYIRSNTGFSIGFTGPDGAGKTTVINLLTERLSPVFAKAHRYYHFRPELFGNIGDVAQSAGLKQDVDRKYGSPHRGGKTGYVSSLFRLFYYSTDYLLGYFVKVKPVLRITRLVIFDRYYTDIICDSRRSRIFLNYKFLYWFGRLFIPSLDYNILLTTDAETILTRKEELDRGEIVSINEKIAYLSGKTGYKVIRNDHTSDDAASAVLSHIFTRQHRENLKKIIR